MAETSRKKKVTKTAPVKTKKRKAALPEIVKSASNRRKPRKITEKKSVGFSNPLATSSYFAESRGFELPQNYGDNKIVLLVRDPHWLHSFWELPQYKIDELRSEIGAGIFNQSTKILRIYDVTDIIFTGINANKTFDIQLSETSRNWYINVGEPNRSWCVDIGFLTPEGRFYVASRSNIVSTPRDNMSEIIDEEWMTIDWDKMYALSGGFGIGKSSAEIKEIFKKRLRQEIPIVAVDSNGGNKKVITPIVEKRTI